MLFLLFLVLNLGFCGCINTRVNSNIIHRNPNHRIGEKNDGEFFIYTNWALGESNDDVEGGFAAMNDVWNEFGELEIHYSIYEWEEPPPPPDLSVFIFVLALILIIPEIYFGRKLSRALGRKNEEGGSQA